VRGNFTTPILMYRATNAVSPAPQSRYANTADAGASSLLGEARPRADFCSTVLHPGENAHYNVSPLAASPKLKLKQPDDPMPLPTTRVALAAR
jgi:hypothetical protein